MLRTLRRMRARLLAEGQLGRYLRYALGELVLVVVGILVALQLNTANQKRIEQGKLRAHVEALVADLAQDRKMLATIRWEMDYVYARVVELERYVRETPLEELDNLRLFVLMRAPYYRPYTWNTAALEQMTASGALGHMEDRELAARISSYEALQRHLLDDYAHDREIAARALTYANRVVDMGYPTLANWVSARQLMTGDDFLDIEGAFVRGDVLERLRALDLDMIRRDRESIREAVGAYQQIIDAYGLWPRTAIEMGRADEIIRELQRDLCGEYEVSPPPPFVQPTSFTPGDDETADGG